MSLNPHSELPVKLVIDGGRRPTVKAYRSILAKDTEVVARRLLFIMFFALGACGQTDRAAQVATAPATQSPANRAPEYDAPSISLRGDWRVAGLDGVSFNEPVGIALKGDNAAIWWEPRCAGMARGYQTSGRSISFRSLEPPRAPGSPTPPVCAIGLPTGLDEVFAALDAATSIERTPANGLQISGGRRSVVLFSQ